MRIYNEIVIDVNPESPTFNETIYEDSYEYSGDVALCIDIYSYGTDMAEYIRAQNDAQKDGNVTPEESADLAKLLTAIMTQTPLERVEEEQGAQLANITSQVETGQETFMKTEEATTIREAPMVAQRQASDIQANPLPSLPSISNVGSVPFLVLLLVMLFLAVFSHFLK